MHFTNYQYTTFSHGFRSQKKKTAQKSNFLNDFSMADNPDFDTMTPSYKSGVSLLQKRGQTGRAWGQIPNYVNLMGSKQIPQALVLKW